jgi:uncharacterized protein YyaL (SSP411 family)
MEHEHFEDPDTAALMNEHFVNIKVDREERPDVDSMYMTAIVALHGQGGWPLHAFLLPEDGTPFYGGTYFPPDDKAARYGMPSFKQVLLAIAEAYRTRREELRQAGDQIVAVMQQYATPDVGGQTIPLTQALLDSAFANLQRLYDDQDGGFGGAPRFPQPMVLEFLLRVIARTSDTYASIMLSTVLHRMAHGGIYDQVGGGFHRYSVDAHWKIPHFEKMLYDQARLSRLYTEAYQATNTPLYQRIAQETLDYVAREMTHPDGGFYSSQDADSEGREGAFFVWTREELQQILGKDADLFCHYYGVTEQGNFEGSHVLFVATPLEELTNTMGLSREEITATIARCRATLYTLREQRVKPGRDDKVITAWNGMMLRAFATAAAVFNRSDYFHIAQRNAAFLLERLRQADGRVLRSWLDILPSADADVPMPSPPPITGYLEDYAQLADGLLALYQVNGNPRWLEETLALADRLLDLFWDDTLGGFYDTPHDHEHLLLRPRDVGDNAIPSGSAVAADVLLRLAALTNNDTYNSRAMQVLTSLVPIIQHNPYGYGRWLCAADNALGVPREVVLVAEDVTGIEDMLEVLYQSYRPTTLLAYRWTTGQHSLIYDLPLFAGRTMQGDKPTAYVCEGQSCKMPVTSAEALREQLGG